MLQGAGIEPLKVRGVWTAAAAASGDPDRALAATLASTGRAIRWNALVLSLGFLVLTLSDLKPNHNLGLLLAGAMVSCYVTTLLFLPPLLRANPPSPPREGLDRATGV